MSLAVTFGDVVIMRVMLSASVLFIVSVRKQTTIFPVSWRFYNMCKYRVLCTKTRLHYVTLHVIHRSQVCKTFDMRLENTYRHTSTIIKTFFHMYKTRCTVTQPMRWWPYGNVLIPSGRMKRLSSNAFKHNFDIRTVLRTWLVYLNVLNTATVLRFSR